MIEPKPTQRTRRPLPYRARRCAQPRRSSGSIRSQFKRHSVALISLAIALASLGYNTWRNETSELHRNWRQAAFQITVELNELQQIVLYRRYFHGRQEHPFTPLQDAETWINGWGKVASIRDLSSLLPEPLPQTGLTLHGTWEKHAGSLDDEDGSAAEAEAAMLKAIDESRQATLQLIDQLSVMGYGPELIAGSIPVGQAGADVLYEGINLRND